MNFKKWPVGGILSLALSVLIFVNPKDIAKSLMITLRLVVLVPGITLVTNALRLIKIQRQDQLVTIDPAGQSKCFGTPRWKQRGMIRTSAFLFFRHDRS